MTPSATQRMREVRRRRAQDRVLVTVEVGRDTRDWLIENGPLSPVDEDDVAIITKAVQWLLDRCVEECDGVTGLGQTGVLGELQTSPREARMYTSKLPQRPPLDDRIRLAVAPEDKRAVFEAAAKRGQTASEFIRQAVLAAATEQRAA